MNLRGSAQWRVQMQSVLTGVGGNYLKNVLRVGDIPLSVLDAEIVSASRNNMLMKGNNWNLCVRNKLLGG